MGANGSGKSNVVDAIRWCLGEQSMRDLRGRRAEDIIHLGARRSLGLAEVGLTFEGISGDSSPAEDNRSVARRFYRSGESEYLVDGLRVRLRDLQDTLRSLDIGGAGHVIVTQGMADGLLTASPGERRILLESAAGLGTYRARRDEARQKIAATDANIVTMETVLAEIEPRLRLLRRQARAVSEREDARLRLTALLRLYYAHRWQRLNTALAASQTELHRVQTERGAVEERLRESEAAAREALRAEREFNTRMHEATAALHAAEREHDSAHFKLAECERRLAAAEETLQQNNRRLDVLTATMSDTAPVVHTTEAEQGRLRARRQELDERLPRLRSECRRLMPEADAARKRLENAQDVRHNLEREVTALRHEFERLVSLQAGEQDALEDLTRQIEAGREERDLLAVQLESATARSADALGRLDSLTVVVREAEELRDQDRVRLERLSRLSARVNRKIDVFAKRLAHLERAIFHASADGSPGAITVAPGWEEAVAAVLAVCRQDSNDTFETGDERERFVAWRDRLADCIGPGIWADTVVDGLPGAGLHPLLGAVLVRDVNTALAVWGRIRARAAHEIGSPPVQIVSRDGSVLWALGAGRRRDTDGGATVLRARSEFAHVTRAGEILRQRQESLVRAISTSGDAARRSNERFEHALAAMREAEGIVTKSGRVVEELRRQIDRSGEQDEALDRRARRLEMERQERVEQRGRLEVRISELEDQCEAQVRQIPPLEQRWKRLQGELQGVQALIQSTQTELDVASATEAAHVVLLERAREDSRRREREQAELQQQATSTEAARRAVIAERDASRDRVSGAFESLRRVREQIDRLRRDTPGADTESSDVMAELRDHSLHLSARQERLALAHEQLSAQLAQLASEVEADLGVPPDALHPPADGQECPTEDDVRKLRVRAQQYQDADEGSIVEFEELDQRYRGLHAHVLDLGAASRQLRHIMAEADAEMTERFNRAMIDVNEEFDRVFALMLRGGSASLEQVNDEGGVGIQAQLPGKRVQSSATFSGGERSLIASSLLFGVLRIRPAPFCVLDEVDAALDESNVDRYLVALRSIAERTQTIVVTHNRATMAAASALYGLTMDGEGVSGVLSLRLDGYGAAV